MTREENLAFLDQVIKQIKNANQDEIEIMKEIYNTTDDFFDIENEIAIYVADELLTEELSIDWENICVDTEIKRQEIDFVYNKQNVFEPHKWQNYDCTKKMAKIA